MYLLTYLLTYLFNYIEGGLGALMQFQSNLFDYFWFRVLVRIYLIIAITITS